MKMKHTFLSLTACVALIAAAFTSNAQPRGGGQMGGMSPEVQAAMLRIFGKNTEFSAKAKITLHQEKDMTMDVNMAMLDGKSRSEMDMGTMKGMEMPPQAIAQMKQLGMDKLVSISRPDEERVYMVYPNAKAYVEMPMPKSQVEAAKKDVKVDKTELGKETIEGHPCVKNKVVITDGEEKHEMTVWNATDLKDFPVKMAFNEEGQKIDVVYKDVKFSKPEASLFDAPKNMEKFENLQQMMMQKMMGAFQKP